MAGLVGPPSVPGRQGIEAWAWLALWIVPGRRPPLRAMVQCAMCNGTGCISIFYIELGGVGTWPHLHPIGAPQGPWGGVGGPGVRHSA